MLRSNIDGLADVLNRFEDRLRVVESLEQRIIGGDNIRVNKLAGSIIINADPAGDSAPSASEPCTFIFAKFDQSEPSSDSEDATYNFKLKALGGTVNGLIPANYEDIGTFSSDTNYFVTLDVTTDATGITQLEYKKHTQLPAITPQYAEGLPPSDLQFFACLITEGSVTSSLCKNISLIPQVAYLDKSAEVLKTMYTWQVDDQ